MGMDDIEEGDVLTSDTETEAPCPAGISDDHSWQPVGAAGSKQIVMHCPQCDQYKTERDIDFI